MWLIGGVVHSSSYSRMCLIYVAYPNQVKRGQIVLLDENGRGHADCVNRHAIILLLLMSSYIDMVTDDFIQCGQDVPSIINK